jgi:hypothetical protein
MDDSETQEQRAERIMARERHRPFPYSNDGLETATLIYDLTAECAKLRAEAANSAAQRDEAVLRATQAEERLRAVEADLAAESEAHGFAITALINAHAYYRADLARRDAAERNHTAAGGAADA